jgi:hypothetical protein
MDEMVEENNRIKRINEQLQGDLDRVMKKNTNEMMEIKQIYEEKVHQILALQ